MSYSLIGTATHTDVLSTAAQPASCCMAAHRAASVRGTPHSPIDPEDDGEEEEKEDESDDDDDGSGCDDSEGGAYDANDGHECDEDTGGDGDHDGKRDGGRAFWQKAHAQLTQLRSCCNCAA